MRAPARLALYGLALVAVFAVAFVAAGAVVPEQTVRGWADDGHAEAHGVNGDGRSEEGSGATSLGLAVAQDGYRLTEVSAPTAAGVAGELTLTVTGPGGEAVTDFRLEHEEELHLVVVRADGRHFRHVHPDMGADGTWVIPWSWEDAGSYRVFADFVPAETGEGITVSTSVQVAGDYAPDPPRDQVAAATVEGFEVAAAGDLVAGGSSTLTMTVARDGEPVTELEPYLGAYGHLVALREGDLAYLHAHPRGEEPRAGETSGPEIVFEASAPTPGRYLLFLDFQVDGRVHTAPFVIETATTTGDEHEEGVGHDHD